MSVPDNIKKIIEQRKVKLYALSLSYAGKAINIFRQRQAGGNSKNDFRQSQVGSNGAFWANQTDQALKKMFSNAFIDGNEIGFFMSHGVEYGVYLELANDRQNESIRPIMLELAPEFFKAVKEIF